MRTRKEDVRVTKTKSAVRKAFLKLAGEHKISELSVKDISDEAGINRTTFYLHYKTIDDIYQDIVNEHTLSCREIIERHKSELTDFDFCGCANDFVLYYDNAFGVKEAFVGSGFISCLKRKTNDILCETLVELYNNTDMIDKYIAVSGQIMSGLVYCFIAVLSDWISSNRTIPLEELCREYREVVVNGIKKR